MSANYAVFRWKTESQQHKNMAVVYITGGTQKWQATTTKLNLTRVHLGRLQIRLHRNMLIYIFRSSKDNLHSNLHGS